MFGTCYPYASFAQVFSPLLRLTQNLTAGFVEFCGPAPFAGSAEMTCYVKFYYQNIHPTIHLAQVMTVFSLQLS
jgi:hypothetical protein